MVKMEKWLKISRITWKKFLSVIRENIVNQGGRGESDTSRQGMQRVKRIGCHDVEKISHI